MMCLDINVGDVESPLVMSPCHKQGGTQFFAITKNQMIVTSREHCVGAHKQLYTVISVNCNDEETQSWKYDNKVSFIVRKWKC